MEKIEAYCVRCKDKRMVKDAVDVTYKNGRKAKKGKCTECGTTCCRIVGAVKA